MQKKNKTKKELVVRILTPGCKIVFKGKVPHLIIPPGGEIIIGEEGENHYAKKK